MTRLEKATIVLAAISFAAVAYVAGIGFATVLIQLFSK